MARRGPREIELAVEALGEDGLGEGTYDGRRVKARNALPGETVNVRVLKRRRGEWFGEADTPGPPPAQGEAGAIRRNAPCPNYPRCGGCVMQHIDYAAQLEHKTRLLERLLAANGIAPQRWRAPVTGPRLHYRFKARLGVRVVGDELLVGFREGFSNRVARMDDCKTLALPFARMLPDLKRSLARLSSPHRIPQVELAAGDRTFAVIIRHLEPLTGRDLDTLAGFGAASGMSVYLQPGGYDTVAPLNGGSGMLDYINPELGLRYEFLPTDFTQVNPYINRALVRQAVLALQPLDERVAVDLFCGIGNFGLALARLGARVHGFESAGGAVERATRNAAGNGLTGRAEFAVADLYDSRCPPLPDSDVLMLDPPRSGAGPNLERWVDSSRLQRIVYVSCNPRTFASDAARLGAAGYDLLEAGIFDMFPHTAHVETLGIFVRPGVPTRG